MNTLDCRSVSLLTTCAIAFLSLGSSAPAQPSPVTGQPFPPSGREFPIGGLDRLDQLPAGRLRSRLESLPSPAQERALQWLRSFHFTEADLPSLHADAAGGILYACGMAGITPVPEAEPPPVAEATVPVSPFPASLIFHSKPGAANVLFINFSGEAVTGTQWNTELARDPIPAVAFSADADLDTFSDAEQVMIKRIWQRMAEDYAPFNIDVTTERPATFTTRTAMALITRRTDANGAPNPFNSAGGVAYVNVFGTTSYAKYRPAWIYHDNLYNIESYIAEAASHEVGHNMGLSHDGKTDGTEYYGGHGTDEISWGPLMGTGYNRNVSQWSKGEYYLANNTQDDLATIAGKLTYRTDDHGNTAGTATALVLSGTNIVSTTPENDPARTNTANKGVLERNTDLDVFSFVTGNGPVNLTVNPWIMPSGTRGGNLDVLLELYNEVGTRLATNNAPDKTGAAIQTTLSEGRYYLHVKGTGAGDPFSSTPSGYTSYASLGQYFITGYVTAATTYVTPPQSELLAADLTEPGQTNYTFTVTYSDDVAVDVTTIDSNDLQVTGPNGYDQLARFVSLNTTENGTPRTATYAVVPPGGGVWSQAHNGAYTVLMRANQVGNTRGAFVAAGELGSFKIAVPVTLYAANMDADPGWTLDPQWQYGTPAYSGGGPGGGFTGTKIVGYNLSGNYANNLSAKYAKTPAINTAGSSSLSLRFKRWLRVIRNDTASIQVSTNDSTWLTVWSTSGGVSDTSWQSVQYALPGSVAGSASVRLRWGLSSNPNQNDIGWNIDDVELLGDGTVDTTPPTASLSVANLTLGGSPSHACSVTYSDATAVRLGSLDSTDLAVTGPNGYSNLVEFVGADLPADGSPLTGTYSIPAPGGSWDAADNGTYTVILLEDAVEDTLNNVTAQAMLGTFEVSISSSSPGVLQVFPVEGLAASGTVGGPFSPSSLSYMLTNSGGSVLHWTASKSANWLSLGATSGTLATGATATVTVSLNTSADGLPAGSYSDTVSFVNTSTGVGSTIRNVTLAVNPGTVFTLTVGINQPAWGFVAPGGGVYAAGTMVELLATPHTYYRFVEWQGDVFGTNNPLPLALHTNLTVRAIFDEIRTTNYPTPYAWLAEHGYTNDMETVVTRTGANGFPLWQSYVAGLNPNDPQSQLRIAAAPTLDGAGCVLRWNPVPDRLYTLWSGTNLTGAFSPLPGAVDLPAAIGSVTNAINTTEGGRFYRLEVRKP